MHEQQQNWTKSAHTPHRHKALSTLEKTEENFSIKYIANKLTNTPPKAKGTFDIRWSHSGPVFV